MDHTKNSSKAQLSPKVKVHVAQGQDAYLNTKNVLSQLDLSCFQGKKVLLKPNIGRIAPKGKGIVTNAQVVAAAFDVIQSVASDVAIGESPIVGVQADEAFAAAGISEIARPRNCRLIDLNKKKYVIKSIPGGVAIQSLKVCEDVYAFDAIVSIPVIKMHMHTGASIGIKNMKGCLWRRSKVDLHMLPPIDGLDEKPIDVAIADLSQVLKPNLTIVDGMVGMEGLGPSAGEPKALGVVLGGFDAFATDAVACELMGISAFDIPHLAIAAKRGYGTIDLDRIHVQPRNWRDWAKTFARPPKNLSIEFPNVKIHDKNSCSACQSTLLLFLKRYRKVIFDYFPKGTILNFAIGKGNTDFPDHTVCIGNCTGKKVEGHTFIKGCPPVVSEIMKAITGNPYDDFMDGHSQISDVEE